MPLNPRLSPAAVGVRRGLLVLQFHAVAIAQPLHHPVGGFLGHSAVRRQLVPDAVVDVAELEALCKSELAGYKRPRRYEVVTELPKTATGKIQRFKLRSG